MNATLSYEPYRLPAGILALLVHGAFFALLYFGFNWQTLPPAAMSVDLWQSLPDTVSVSPAKPKIEEIVKPAQPEKIAKPDIALPNKEKVRPKAVMPEPDKEVVKTKPIAPVEQTPAPPVVNQQADGAQALKDAAIGRVVAEYKAKIMAKIRRNIVMPPNVRDDARAEFVVTLLPDGEVLPPRLTKPSGNEAYDNAVERAILKSQPLPLPAANAMLFNRFRELQLSFKPTE